LGLIRPFDLWPVRDHFWLRRTRRARDPATSLSGSAAARPGGSELVAGLRGCLMRGLTRVWRSAPVPSCTAVVAAPVGSGRGLRSCRIFGGFSIARRYGDVSAVAASRSFRSPMLRLRRSRRWTFSRPACSRPSWAGCGGRCHGVPRNLQRQPGPDGRCR